MNPTEYSEKDALKAQIRQLREFLATTNREMMMSQQTLWLNLKNNTSGKIHPRLRKMIDEPTEMETVEKGLARLERDLKDMDRTERQLKQAPDKIMTGGGDTEQDAEEEPTTAKYQVDDSQKSLYEYTE